MTDPQDVKQYIVDLIERARTAQMKIESASQEQVDEICARIAWAGVQHDFASKLAERCVEDSGMGRADHKYAKLMTKIKGTLRDMKGKKSVGIVEYDKEKGLMKVAKPVGVIGALIPVTNSEATPFVKVLSALKTRNAIVMAPHPRTLKTNQMIVAHVRSVLKQQGWPEDLILNVDELSVEASKELMAQCDLVIATGGAGMVKAAYSSGTPCYGVGAGNAVCIVDETADLKDAAEKIMRSKIFDHATSCSTENSLAIQEDIYVAMLKELEAVGGYVVSPEEKQKLQKTMWVDGVLSRHIVGQSAAKIANLAGIDLPEGKSFFLIEESGVGSEYPFSGEKLSVTAAVYTWKTFDRAIDLANRITSYSGQGHSCGIHSSDESRIRQLSLKVNISRIMIRQPQCLANSGAWTNGMPMTLTLGCGTWGGNVTTSNVTWEHMLNYSWVSFPIPNTQPTDEELFGTIMYEA